LKFRCQTRKAPITSPVASISRAVHTALSMLHQIPWRRNASSQTYIRQYWSSYVCFLI
jgi:hypothetical protein